MILFKLVHDMQPALQTAVWMHIFKNFLCESTLQKLKYSCHFKKNTECHFKPPVFKVEHLTTKFVKGQRLWHADVSLRAHTCLFSRFTAKMNFFLGPISCSLGGSRTKMIIKDWQILLLGMVNLILK